MTGKIIPAPSNITEEEFKKIHEASETHSVPFGWMRVDAFKSPVLREAFAQYFQPDYDDPRERRRDPEGNRDTSALWQLMYNVVPQGLFNGEGASEEYLKKYDFSEVKVRARILLTYPLNDTWEATVELHADRLGDVFCAAYDMYVHIYELDDQEWRKKGHQDQAPRLGRLVLNRARGEHVWGHDMSDLVFEWMSFAPAEDWPKTQRKNIRIIDVVNASSEGEDPQPKVEEVLEPLSVEKHKGKTPFIGTFTFFIGS